MGNESQLIERIRRSVEFKKYRIRIHAVRHMIEEGFDERDLTQAMAGRCKLLEDYRDEFRCLVLGHFNVSGGLRSPLHVVIDYSNRMLIDIVTAYIPQKPWWETPEKRRKLK